MSTNNNNDMNNGNNNGFENSNSNDNNNYHGGNRSSLDSRHNFEDELTKERNQLVVKKYNF